MGRGWYEIGHPCSKCQQGYTCVNNLCVAPGNNNPVAYPISTTAAPVTTTRPPKKVLVKPVASKKPCSSNQSPQNRNCP